MPPKEREHMRPPKSVYGHILKVVSRTLLMMTAK
nr:MAG TPA: hypothetical protein [Caudoviricetes sp.]